MKLGELTDHQWVIVETMYDASVLVASCEGDDYQLTPAASTTLNELRGGSGAKVADLIAEGGCDGAEDDVVLVFEGTVSGATPPEWCRVYIPAYWD